MVEAVTVCYRASRRALSPLFHGFYYLSSLTSVFCGEFPANVMIPVRGGGRGIPQFSVHTGPGQCPSRKRAQGLFRSRNPPLADGPPNAKHHAQCRYRIWYNGRIMSTARKITVEIPDDLLQKAQIAS